MPDSTRRRSARIQRSAKQRILVILALLLGGASLLGGKLIAGIVVAVAIFAIVAWLVLTPLGRDAVTIVAVCDNGLIASSRQNPLEFVPWAYLRTMALKTWYVRFGGVGRALHFDFGRSDAIVLPDEDLDALMARVVAVAKLRSVTRMPGDRRFDSSVLLLWERTSV